ncbi:MAG: glycosyltransferase family 4 protein [Thermoguttaceae bacterium]
MRIGLVIEHFDPRRGGAEQWTGRLARWLLDQGHEVHIVCCDKAATVGRASEVVAETAISGATHGRGFVDGVAADDLPSQTATPPSPILHRLGPARSRLAFAAAAETKLRGLSLDVVHDMGVGWFGDVLQSHDGSRLAQWDRKLLMLPPWLRPLKRRLIGVLPRYREFRKLAARQYGDPRRLVIAMSRRAADDYERYHGVRPSQIRVIYHGVDAQRLSPARSEEHRASMRSRLGFSNNDIVLLLMAHNFALKGLATLIRALGRLRRTGGAFQVAVVGHGRPARFVRLARTCGVGSAVRFLGPADDPLPYYSMADVYVQPTFYDSFGLTVLEAAACGRPIVTTQAAGVSELLTDGQDGYVLDDPGDDAGLAAQLQTLADPTVRTSMGRAARRLAERHTFDDNCRQIAAVYDEILERRPPLRADQFST